MGIHMNLDYHEPPQGDFVQLIERMVGAPPNDPELAAKELSARLAARARRARALNEAEADTMYGETPNSVTVSTTVADGPPDVGDALRQLAGGGVRSLINNLSKVLMAIGFLIFAATGIIGIDIPLIEPLHGIVALIVGVFLNNATS